MTQRRADQSTPGLDPGDPSTRPVLILGPTAGGKSDLAIDLARELGGEVISADSMQVYRELDAGTAKPSPDERTQVRHHLIDCVDPTERFTVADWLKRADQTIADLRRRGVRPIVVGGTNLYIRALLEGLFEGPPHDTGLRAELEGQATEALWAELRRCDPETADRLHPNDRKRIVRAVEVYRLSGRPLSHWQRQWSEAKAETGRPSYRHDPLIIGLNWAPEAINRRINLRVKAMFHPAKALEQDGIESWVGRGLPDEVRELWASDRLGPQAAEALGYKQVLASLAGRMSLEEAYEQTKVQTRRFARQQRTWLKRFRGLHGLQADGLERSDRAEVALRWANSQATGYP